MAVMTERRTEVRTDEPIRPDVFWRWVWASTRPYRGQLLLVLGFVLMLFGYLGVSREVLVARQIPYLVSGGLLGVALVSLGGRYLLIEDLRRDSGRLQRLEEAVTDLRAALLAQPDAPALDAPARGSSTRNGTRATVLVVNGGGSFHRSECAVVEGKEQVSRITPDSAKRKGLRACPMCQPLSADA